MSQTPRSRPTSAGGPAKSDGPAPDVEATGPTPLRLELDRSYAEAEDGRPTAVEVVRVVGEVDLTTADQVVTMLAGLIVRPAAHVVVDTTGMTFCGLRGLAVLHDAARLATAYRTGFAIVGLSPQLTRLSRELWPAPHPTTCSDRAGAVSLLVARAAEPSAPAPCPGVTS